MSARPRTAVVRMVAALEAVVLMAAGWQLMVALKEALSSIYG